MYGENEKTAMEKAPGELLDIEATEISAANFQDYAHLQMSLDALDEAVIEFGKTVGFLNRHGSMAEQAIITEVHRAALIRRGRLQRLCYQAQDGRFEHLQPAIIPEVPAAPAVPLVEMIPIAEPQNTFGLKSLGNILGWNR